MKKLQPVQIDDNTIIYVEAADDIDTSDLNLAPEEPEEPEETLRGGQKSPWSNRHATPPSQPTPIQTLDTTIHSYTSYTLNAIKDSFYDVATANVSKVTLEFGVNVDVTAGIPYIANGTAACNVKVTVECTFTPPATTSN
ncbi:MAG: hypothetical protein IGR80_01690 [Synechococcales cyanobacterium K44_A2020_017]|nr:hypothetical protein [Synechococcales cyanobacterium K32_A2020_035]MBF2093454.1 hypothetical protein [Synechococcales cyanobacterium K44_A2020_017]